MICIWKKIYIERMANWESEVKEFEETETNAMKLKLNDQTLNKPNLKIR